MINSIYVYVYMYVSIYVSIIDQCSVQLANERLQEPAASGKYVEQTAANIQAFKPSNKPLADLVTRLLKPNPLDRPSATAALAHEFFRESREVKLHEERQLIDTSQKHELLEQFLQQLKRQRREFQMHDVDRKELEKSVFTKLSALKHSQQARAASRPDGLHVQKRNRVRAWRHRGPFHRVLRSCRCVEG